MAADPALDLVNGFRLGRFPARISARVERPAKKLLQEQERRFKGALRGKAAEGVGENGATGRSEGETSPHNTHSSP